MSKTFIGGAICREIESEAPAAEEMLDRITDVKRLSNILVFVSLIFDSRNIVLIVRWRTVQPKLYRSNSVDCALPRCTDLLLTPHMSTHYRIWASLSLYAAVYYAARYIIDCDIER